MPYGPSVCSVLQSVLGGSGIETGAGVCPGHLGAGDQWNIFCGHVAPHPQPGVDAAAGAVSDLDTGSAEHGECHGWNPDRRFFSDCLDRVVGWILRGLYYP